MMAYTFCRECGFGVKIDDDDCCVYCGSVAATGSVVDYGDAGERIDKILKELPVQMPVQATVLDNGVVIDEGE